jgi:hypothetical protein
MDFGGSILACDDAVLVGKVGPVIAFGDCISEFVDGTDTLGNRERFDLASPRNDLAKCQIHPRRNPPPHPEVQISLSCLRARGNEEQPDPRDLFALWRKITQIRPSPFFPILPILHRFQPTYAGANMGHPYRAVMPARADRVFN